MSLWRFEPEEVLQAIQRTVRWRWPGEHLLVAVPCEAEWALVPDGWNRELSDDDADLAVLEELGREPGALGVTERRIVYRSLDRQSWAFPVAAWTFAGLAGIGLLAREPTMTPIAGGLAIALWALARVVEVFGLGSGAIELGGILEVDGIHQRIHAVDRWGIHYRLRLAEGDFARVARLVGG